MLSMVRAVKKQAVAPKKPKVKRAPTLQIGPDGLTFPQRLRALLYSLEVGQTELARLCSQYFAGFMPGNEELVSQQLIFNILKGQGSTEYLPLIAAVLDVNELWLQFGIGPKERHARV